MQKTKFIKNGDRIIVIFNNGSFIQKDGATDDLFLQVCRLESEEDIRMLLCPEYLELINTCNETSKVIDNITKSNILTFKNDAAYWTEISELSIPQELVEAILAAEASKDELLLETYKNFWTLMSLNPDEQCRLNLFWFLNKWGLKISRCGFFVAYRNVDIHKESTEENPIYTDNYTHTFKIKIGDMVTMDRDKCNSNSDISCSKGLHAGGAGWLDKNYCGVQGLVVLINPAEVVAVPKIDDYGKLRCCAYLPICKAEFDTFGKIIPYDAKDGFECEYVPKVIYEGLMGTEKDTNYKLVIPDIPGINKESISNKLLDIARETISHRIV